MPYAQIHTPATLGELAVMYKPGAEFVADEVAPITPTSRKQVKFHVHSRADMNRTTDTAMADTGLPNRRTFSTTTTQVDVLPWGLHDIIPISDLNDPEPGVDLEADTVEYLTHDVLLGHEARVATLVTTAGSYASANKVTLGTPWTSALSTPIADIQTGKRACAVTPNRAVCDEVTFDALARHPDIISTLRGTSGAVVNGLATAEEIARYFGLEKIVVGRCKYNSANPTATESYTYVWPQGKFLLYRYVPTPRQREVLTARTYRFNGNPNGLTMNVESIEQKEPGTQGVLFVKVTMEEYSGLVAADTGYLISSAA